MVVTGEQPVDERLDPRVELALAQAEQLHGLCPPGQAFLGTSKVQQIGGAREQETPRPSVLLDRILDCENELGSALDLVYREQPAEILPNEAHGIGLRCRQGGWVVQREQRRTRQHLAHQGALTHLTSPSNDRDGRVRQGFQDQSLSVPSYQSCRRGHVPRPSLITLARTCRCRVNPDPLVPIETMKVGSLGTLHALGLAKEKGARFLLASTSETYGDPQVHPQPETYWGHVNPVGPRGVYDEAKRFAEALTMAYRRTHQVDTAIVRIFNTHGPRMRPNDGRAIPAFATQALTGKPITVAGDGSQTLSIIYVDDLIVGILKLLRSNLAGPVNIGNPHETSVLHLAETIKRLTASRSEIVFIERPTDDPTVRQPDITLAETELGWAPKVG